MIVTNFIRVFIEETLAEASTVEAPLIEYVDPLSHDPNDQTSICLLVEAEVLVVIIPPTIASTASSTVLSATADCLPKSRVEE
jgi:hypothetical protein